MPPLITSPRQSITPHRGGQMIFMTVPAKTNIVQNILGMREHVLRQTESRARKFAVLIEAEMKRGAQWNDQPGDIHRPPRYPNDHARAQLFAHASRHLGNKEKIVVQFGHAKETYMQTKGQRSDARRGARKVTYGGILESGRFWRHNTGEKYAIVKLTYRNRRDDFRRLGDGVIKSYRAQAKEKISRVFTGRR